VGRAASSRIPFLIAVALVAAAIADPVVESISNTGVFGGHYADDNHTGVIPTLLAGLLLMFEIAAVRCFQSLRSSNRSNRSNGSNGSNGRLADVAREFSTRSPARDLPSVLALQLAVLFMLESTEQLLVGGKLLGGIAWLGGPICFSVVTHALVGSGCLLLLRRLTQAMSTAFASLVRIAIEFVLLVRVLGEHGAVLRRRDEPAHLRAQSPHVRQIGGRAPPLLQTA
jgi:hypothetical protein